VHYPVIVITIVSVGYMHSNKCLVVLTQFWVKYGQPSHWVTFLIYISNPMAGFVHILPRNWVKTTQHF